jgi:hypothetical protein
MLVVVVLASAVAGCSDCDLKITSGSLPNGVVGAEYRVNLKSDCGGDEWFVAGGNLPPGIELQSDGDLRGVPAAAGAFVFTVGVFDFDDQDEAFKGFQIVVVEATS